MSKLCHFCSFTNGHKGKGKTNDFESCRMATRLDLVSMCDEKYSKTTHRSINDKNWRAKAQQNFQCKCYPETIHILQQMVCWKPRTVPVHYKPSRLLCANKAMLTKTKKQNKPMPINCQKKTLLD